MTRSKKVLEMIEGEYQQWFKGEKLPGVEDKGGMKVTKVYVAFGCEHCGEIHDVNYEVQREGKKTYILCPDCYKELMSGEYK